MGSSQYFTVPSGGTYLSNEVIKNPDLTYDALGLLLAMLSMHPAQAKTRDTLTGRGLGRRAVSQALRVLEAAGFRYRFRYVLDNGQWRTATVLFDSPRTAEAAFDIVQGLIGSASGRVRSWADGDGRRLDGRGLPVVDGDKTAGQTEVPQAVPREGKVSTTPVDENVSHDCGVASQTDPGVVSGVGAGADSEASEGYFPCSDRGTAGRPSVDGTLNISKDIFSNKTKVLSSNQPDVRVSRLSGMSENPHRARDARPESPVDPSAGGVVGVDVNDLPGVGEECSPTSPTPRVNASEVDSDLLSGAVPAPFLDVLGKSGQERVSAMLRDAYEAGWTSQGIYARLNKTGSLDGATNPAGLVIYRLGDILASPPPRDSRAARLAERERALDTARADCEAIIAGTSTLSLTQQQTRVNGYGESYEIVRHYQDLLDKAEQAIQARLQHHDGVRVKKKTHAR